MTELYVELDFTHLVINRRVITLDECRLQAACEFGAGGASCATLAPNSTTSAARIIVMTGDP